MMEQHHSRSGYPAPYPSHSPVHSPCYPPPLAHSIHPLVEPGLSWQLLSLPAHSHHTENMGSCASSPSNMRGIRKRNPVSLRHTQKIQNAVVEDTNESSEDVIAPTFEQKYHFSERVLGEGADGKIFEGCDTLTGDKVALKVSTFNDFAFCSKSEERRKKFKREVHILGMTKHRGVVQCLDFHEEEHQGILVLEFAEGGDLFDRMRELRRLSEYHAREIIVHIAEAVWYLHSLDIVHRDLKPENILLKSKTSFKDILIADFGYAAIINEDEWMYDLLGTLHYVAPEILLKKPYGKSVDIWALGVIMFIILSGCFPFQHEDHAELFRTIVRGEYSFEKNSDIWVHISDDAKDLLRNLLVVDPARRFTISQVLIHPWITNYKDCEDEEQYSYIYSSEGSDGSTDYASVTRLPEAARAALLL